MFCCSFVSFPAMTAGATARGVSPFSLSIVIVTLLDPRGVVSLLPPHPLLITRHRLLFPHQCSLHQSPVPTRMRRVANGTFLRFIRKFTASYDDVEGDYCVYLETHCDFETQINYIRLYYCVLPKPLVIILIVRIHCNLCLLSHLSYCCYLFSSL